MMMFVSINGTAHNGGGSIFQYNPSGKQNTALSSLDRPRGLDFDKTNNLFVATNKYDVNTDNLQGTIFKITAGGETSTLTAGFPANFFLEGLVTDSHGNVFVVAQNQTDPNGACTIFLITPSGAISPFGSTPGESFGLAFDSAGNLFVADSADLTIFKFTPAGVQSVFAAPASFSSGQGPVGLAFDKSGNLFVSTEGNQPNDAILKFTPAGAVSTFATGLSQVPRGLAFSANGHLFVAETGNAAPGDILEFTPEGARTLFASGLGRPEGNGGAEFLAFKRGGSLLP
jgi:DNA-binding beta-propeller fold protein YncE